MILPLAGDLREQEAPQERRDDCHEQRASKPTADLGAPGVGGCFVWLLVAALWHEA